ncbi:uncharacterized protein SEPMUDRAFT_146429 [Sphaerulina musiva SO2202]|uniref:Uncharacterized protein n=1 Tax=Sphaerulina musiva (strain SO2202) TaxID=692275 RepID=N1QNL6_SPHMS|nr:uncharacterized protein SEPMUDRAFT_146429 [Sphaerulina musiva SO2202]EMF17394.1 hypothetical protein SEPMUDRAFT_122781 [Sphaerulina musiva SO2202]
MEQLLGLVLTFINGFRYAGAQPPGRCPRHSQGRPRYWIVPSSSRSNPLRQPPNVAERANLLHQ